MKSKPMENWKISELKLGQKVTPKARRSVRCLLDNWEHSAHEFFAEDAAFFEIHRDEIIAAIEIADSRHLAFLREMLCDTRDFIMHYVATGNPHLTEEILNEFIRVQEKEPKSCINKVIITRAVNHPNATEETLRIARGSDNYVIRESSIKMDKRKPAS